MSFCKLLDCTLRDGAYLINKTFGSRVIMGITEGLVKAGIDYIETGFLQDEGFGEGKTVYRDSADAGRFIPADKQGCRFTALADYSRYSVSNLDRRTEGGIDAVRECFFKHERSGAVDACRAIREKGYEVFVQPVDILGYSDKELIELLEMVNETGPYCFSIVDTFGSMYQEDLHRVFEIVNHNLAPSCKLGFHSHNNMQLSNALSQEFIRMSAGRREAIVDCTVSGMGRGAGNTPTELIAQYLAAKQGAPYDIDAVLDIIDSFMDSIRSRCSWGYSTEYFVAGAYSAHVNNIGYLLKKNSIRSKDIRFILNRIGKDARKRYDYALLEKTYMGMLESQIDDAGARDRLKAEVAGRPVLMLVPGRTLNLYAGLVRQEIAGKNPVVISVNFISSDFKADYLYMSNVKRHRFWKNTDGFKEMKKIMTSNFSENDYDENTIVVSFAGLVKCGWETMDNSAVMLLRLLSDISVTEVGIAGFDGYADGSLQANFVSGEMEISSVTKNAAEINREISGMLADFCRTRKNPEMKIKFITPSRFENCMAE